MTSNSDFFDKNKPVMVIGGRGFVGSHIVRALIEAGIKVHVFGLPMEVDLLADLAGRFDETFGSVLDEAAIGKVIDASGAGAIVTNAAFADGKKGMMRSGDGDAKRAMEINVEGFRRTLEAARARNIKRVIWSDSTVVYGPAALYAKDRVDESDARHPVTIYGLTKVLGEDIAQYYRDRYAMDVVGLRMSLLLGADLWYQGAAHAIAQTIASAGADHRHKVSFHNERIDLMHVSDIARATLLALKSDRPLAPCYNVNGFTACLSDIIEAVEAAVPGYRVNHDVIESPLIFPLISDAAFRSDTGYVPHYGLADIVREFTQGSEP